MLKGNNLTFDWVNARAVAVVEAVTICRSDSGLPADQIQIKALAINSAPPRVTIKSVRHIK
jgi:hypothetical protein